MTVPDFQSLMLPALKRLSERVWATAELTEALADEHGLSLAERSELLPSGQQTSMANRTYWSLIYLGKAGLITRIARGRYEASARGVELLASGPPTRLTIAYLQRYPEFAAFRAAARIDDPPNGLGPARGAIDVQQNTPEETLQAADRSLKAELAATLVTRMQSLLPVVFERLILDVLVKMGYGGSWRDAAERIGRSGDGGIDGIIREDALGLDMIYLQAKRYADDNPVGAPAIQGFAGALLGNGATKGVFVTTGRFTAQARQTALAYKAPRIVLIDGPELARLMIEHDAGVRTVQTIRVQKVALDEYEDGDIE